MAVPRLTKKQHDAVLNSPVGQFLDRLVREEVARGGDTKVEPPGMTIIMRLWKAFHPPEAK